ncbi:hypothetical protein ACFX2I_014821 [Malus domestica]
MDVILKSFLQVKIILKSDVKAVHSLLFDFHSANQRKEERITAQTPKDVLATTKLTDIYSGASKPTHSSSAGATLNIKLSLKLLNVYCTEVLCSNPVSPNVASIKKKALQFTCTLEEVLEFNHVINGRLT